MDELGQAAILGFLQGLTEFLPISSSAHLLVLPWMFGWQPFGLVFDIMLHTGTLIAVLVFFRSDWAKFATQSWTRTRGLFQSEGKTESTLWDRVMMATVPVVIVGTAWSSWIERNARRPAVTVVTLVGFGVLLWIADQHSKREGDLEKLSLWQAFAIGCAQSVALVPGVSRSGITMTAALFCGLSRTEAARFSFLLAGPTIALASLKGVVDLLGGTGLETVTGQALVVGILSAGGIGFLCIKYFLRFLAQGTFLPFVVYRCGLALVILLGLLQ